MIDVHTHILPQMDDGSKSAEQSVQMLNAMQAQGVRLLAATPHFDMRKENIDEFLARRSEAIKRLNAARTEDDPKIIPGAEVLYCGVSLSRMEKVEKLCIGDGNYMLVETLTMQWDDFFEDCLYQLLAEQNITPIVAHIDRYLPYRNFASVKKPRCFDAGKRRVFPAQTVARPGASAFEKRNDSCDRVGLSRYGATASEPGRCRGSDRKTFGKTIHDAADKTGRACFDETGSVKAAAFGE